MSTRVVIPQQEATYRNDPYGAVVLTHYYYLTTDPTTISILPTHDGVLSDRCEIPRGGLAEALSADDVARYREYPHSLSYNTAINPETNALTMNEATTSLGGLVACEFERCEDVNPFHELDSGDEGALDDDQHSAGDGEDVLHEQDHHRQLLWTTMNRGATKETIMEQVQWFIVRKLPLPLSDFDNTVLFDACRQRNGRLIDVDLVDSLMQSRLDPSEVSGKTQSTPAHAIVEGLMEAMKHALEKIPNCRRAMQVLLAFGAKASHVYHAACDVLSMMSKVSRQFEAEVLSVIEKAIPVVSLVACSDEDRQQFPEKIFEDPVAKRQFSRKCGLNILEAVLSGCNSENGETYVDLDLPMNSEKPMRMLLYPHKLKGFIDHRAVDVAICEWPQNLGVTGCVWEYLIPSGKSAWIRADALLKAALDAMQDHFEDSSGDKYKIRSCTFEFQLIGEGQPLHGAICRWKPQTDPEANLPVELARGATIPGPAEGAAAAADGGLCNSESKLKGDEKFLSSLQRQLRRAATITLPRAASNAYVTLDKISDDLYPNFGTAAMTEAFHESRHEYFASEFNLVCIAAARKSMSTKVLQEVSKVCQETFHMPGDITGLNAMMLQVVTKFEAKLRASNGKPDAWRSEMSRAANWFNTHGLGRYVGTLLRALVEAVSLLSRLRAQKIPIRKQDPKNTKAVLGPLLVTHPRHVFLAQAPIFGGPINYYTRGVDCGDLGDSERDDDTTQLRTIASFHSQSSMHKLEPQPLAVLAMDFMLLNAEMKYVENPYQNGVLQNCDPVDVKWLSSITVKKRRFLLLHKEEVNRAKANRLAVVSVPNAKFGYVHLRGPLPKVIADAQTLITKTLRIEKRDIAVECLRPNDALFREQFQANLEELRKNDKLIFKQMKLQWKNTCQMDIVVNLDKYKPRVTVSGRLGDVRRFEDHMKFWSRTLTETPTVHIPFRDNRESFDSFVQPRHIGPNDAEFRQRLRILTHEDASKTELWSQVNGPQATRESRMTIVARIAVLEFGCRLSGGFVRDWIVNGEKKHPAERPDPTKNLLDNAWVETCAKGVMKYDIREGVLPKDIDVELPASQYFDVNRFISRVRECGVSVDHHEHIAQRHVFLFDLEKGPFGMDCVEFHFAALHTMMDFDVNALTVMKGHEGMIGLKLPFKNLTVDKVIARSLKRKMWQLRHEGGAMRSRIDKMTGRGWKVINDVHKCRNMYQPASEDGRTSLVMMDLDDPAVKPYVDEIKALGARQITVSKIENCLQAGLYECNKRIIAAENNGNANEVLLWHGTKEEGGKGILKSGFDDRYWNGGNGAAFGRAAYFAPLAEMSASFANREEGERCLFIFKVALGKIQKNIPPRHPAFHVKSPYHSATGRESHWFPNHDQYMVYRYGQAVPLFLVRYQGKRCTKQTSVNNNKKENINTRLLCHRRAISNELNIMNNQCQSPQ